MMSKGFPLLQNIILQAVIAKNKIDYKSIEDSVFTTDQIGGNGIIGIFILIQLQVVLLNFR